MIFNRKDCTVQDNGSYRIITHLPTGKDFMHPSTFPLESAYFHLEERVLFDWFREHKNTDHPDLPSVKQQILKLMADDA